MRGEVKSLKSTFILLSDCRIQFTSADFSQTT